MSKRFLTTSLILCLTLFLAGGIYMATGKVTEKPEIAGTTTSISDEILVRIGNFENKINFSDGMTALEATRIATNSEVETQGEETEAFVIKIRGQGLEKREFWEFLINDQTALVGAGSYKLKPGDKIEWKISKF